MGSEFYAACRDVPYFSVSLANFGSMPNVSEVNAGFVAVTVLDCLIVLDQTEQKLCNFYDVFDSFVSAGGQSWCRSRPW